MRYRSIACPFAFAMACSCGATPSPRPTPTATHSAGSERVAVAVQVLANQPPDVPTASSEPHVATIAAPVDELPSPPPAVSAPEATNAAPIEYVPLPATAHVAFNLRDATVLDAMRALANISGDRVVITTEASPLARCATITILSPRELRPAQVEPLVRAAIRPSGLVMTRTHEGLIVVDRAPDAPPAHACASQAPAEAATIAAPPPTAAASAQVLAGIRTVSPTEHTITDTAFDATLEHQAELFRNVRIVPHDSNGHVDGVRFFGVRNGELLSALGFLNGDVLVSINHLDITSPDHALEAYSRLRDETTLELQVMRNGAPMVLTVRRVR